MKRDDVMLTCRVPREDVAYIDALAADAGCTRSEYVRRLMKLPVAMQTETGASLRTTHGPTSIDHGAPAVGDAGAAACEGPGRSSGSKTVLVLTDVPIRKLCIAIDRWGTNYNQAVRALNAIVRRLEDQTIVDRDDARDIMYLLTVCAQGNEAAKAGIDGVAGAALDLIGVAKVDMRRRPEESKPSRKRARRADGPGHQRADAGEPARTPARTPARLHGEYAGNRQRVPADVPGAISHTSGSTPADAPGHTPSARRRGE